MITTDTEMLDAMIAEIEELLYSYVELERDIDHNINRYERMKVRLYSIGSPTMSDMPKGSNSDADRFTDKIQKKNELKAILESDMADRDSRKKRIEAMLCQLRRSDERAVIRLRFIDGEEWNDVNEIMWGEKEDFEERMESYLRRCHDLKKRAIRHLAENELTKLGV